MFPLSKTPQKIGLISFKITICSEIHFDLYCGIIEEPNDEDLSLPKVEMTASFLFSMLECIFLQLH